MAGGWCLRILAKFAKSEKRVDEAYAPAAAGEDGCKVG